MRRSASCIHRMIIRKTSADRRDGGGREVQAAACECGALHGEAGVTQELDDAAERFIRSRGISLFHGLPGFSRIVCTSTATRWWFTDRGPYELRRGAILPSTSALPTGAGWLMRPSPSRGGPPAQASPS